MDEIEIEERKKNMSETKLFSNSKKVKYLYKISKFKFCYHIYNISFVGKFDEIITLDIYFSV